MNYTIDFTEYELNVVLSGLGELPAKVSFGMIQKIHALVNEQNLSKEE